MAEFYSPKLTNNGLNLLYKAQGGKVLKYTKFVLGDGNYSGSVRTLTNLVNPVMTVDIKRLNIQTSGTNKKVTIGFNLDLDEIPSSFYLREIGLYAEDPDTHQELLVYYTNAGDTADYITEPESSTTINEAMYDFEIYISDVENITAVIDTSMVYASQAELNALKVKAFSINTSAWALNSTSGLYEATIADSSVNSHDNAEVSFDSATYDIAADAGVKSYVTEIQGTGIKLYADSIPSGTVSGKYNINRGEAV